MYLQGSSKGKKVTSGYQEQAQRKQRPDELPLLADELPLEIDEVSPSSTLAPVTLQV
jgi:hypothetical protein